MKKLPLILLVFLFASCDQINSILLPDDSPGVYINNSKYSISPIGVNTKKLNDSIYIFYIDSSQWQTLEKLSGKSDINYPGMKAHWSSSVKKVLSFYTYNDMVYPSPLVNEYSYFSSDKKTYQMMSVYKEYMNDTVAIISSVLSESGNAIYIDYLYFIIKNKN